MSKVLTIILDKNVGRSFMIFNQIIFARRVKMQTENSKTSDVLFQKLGNTWYVFSEINSEVVYSALPDGINPHTTKLELYEVIEKHLQKVSKTNKQRRDWVEAA